MEDSSGNPVKIGNSPATVTGETSSTMPLSTSGGWEGAGKVNDPGVRIPGYLPWLIRPSRVRED